MEQRFAELLRIYEGSDGDATRALYARLEQLGPVGLVAINLFRAHKTSARAKVYRGRRYKGEAYDRKAWSIDNLSRILERGAAELGISWGWGTDPDQPHFPHVLYVDLPGQGQVSFHAPARGSGPPYPGTWDGIRGVGADRLLRWIAGLSGATDAPEVIIGAETGDMQIPLSLGEAQR